jgi:hypothetical protein
MLDKRSLAFKLPAIFLLFLCPSVVRAQGSSAQQGEQSTEQTKDGKSVKQPAPPLFKRHHRGMYKNSLGIDVIDATPQSPPLEVDDPGVPEKGQYEINFTSEVDFSNQMRAFDFLLVDANYGTLPKIFGHQIPTQIKLECPVAGDQMQGDPLNVGVGATLFGVKFNFYDNEHTGASAAFYPQIEFAVPGTDAARKNLADSGETLIFPLLVRKEFRYLTVVANAGLNEPIHDPEDATTGSLGFGFGRAFTRHLAAMVEFRGDSAFDFKSDRLVVANVGLMRRIRDDLFFYTNVGHSLISNDKYRHVYVGIGVKVLLTPHKNSQEDALLASGSL